jgi:hypothetical protein
MIDKCKQSHQMMTSVYPARIVTGSHVVGNELNAVQRLVYTRRISLQSPTGARLATDRTAAVDEPVVVQSSRDTRTIQTHATADFCHGRRQGRVVLGMGGRLRITNIMHGFKRRVSDTTSQQILSTSLASHRSEIGASANLRRMRMLGNWSAMGDSVAQINY